MTKREIKSMIIHLLKDDMDFMPDAYSEWEENCNQYKAVSFDEKGEIKKIRKKTYHEICQETIKDALNNFPKEMIRSDREEIKDFLFQYLFDVFKRKNCT